MNSSLKSESVDYLVISQDRCHHTIGRQAVNGFSLGMRRGVFSATRDICKSGAEQAGDMN
jgi:hypothetical protein